jgi:hypothetical protein
MTPPASGRAPVAAASRAGVGFWSPPLPPTHRKTFSRSAGNLTVMSKKVLLLVVLVIAVAIAWKMVMND